MLQVILNTNAPMVGLPWTMIIVLRLASQYKAQCLHSLRARTTDRSWSENGGTSVMKDRAQEQSIVFRSLVDDTLQRVRRTIFDPRERAMVTLL